MSEHELYFPPAMEAMDREDYFLHRQISEACDEDTAIPGVRPMRDILVENLRTFANCRLATALWVAYKRQFGENWVPMLVEDTEFHDPEHPLRTHWLAKNLDEADARAIDLTVADNDKTLNALGSEAEIAAVNKYRGDAVFLRQLHIGLSRFRDTDGTLLLPHTTAEELLQIYLDLAQQEPRLPHPLRIRPSPILGK